MNRSRLQIAKPDIVAFFHGNSARVYGPRQIAAILSAQRGGWRLAQNTTVEDFITFLVRSTELKRLAFKFPTRPETLYSWGKVPLLEVLQHLKPRSYFSHYTAMRMHGLTEQVPKTIYLSHERALSPAVLADLVPHSAALTQSAIDAAFARPARVSNNMADFGEQRIVLLNGAFTDELGVVDQAAQHGADESVNVRVTNPERTLIDAAVRPAYSGGVFEVAKAFELARGEGLSVNTMGAMLTKLNFMYPYHQVIGYYLERAGYRSNTVDLLRRFPMEFDFYLTHAMVETRYEKAWRLYVPKGF